VGEREGVGEGGEMTQTLYAHMNKIKIKKKRFAIRNEDNSLTGSVESAPSIVLRQNA
jgi:hypothetical protein